jgi:hypothetical protein
MTRATDIPSDSLPFPVPADRPADRVSPLNNATSRRSLRVKTSGVRREIDHGNDGSTFSGEFPFRVASPRCVGRH